MHGTGKFVECLSCGNRWPSQEIFDRYQDEEEVPVCAACGGWLKPATISFGQALPEDVLEASFKLAESSDLFIVIGSSLVVEPAASLPAHARGRGAFLAIINRDLTPLDKLAHAVIREPIGRTLEAIDREWRILTGVSGGKSEADQARQQ